MELDTQPRNRIMYSTQSQPCRTSLQDLLEQAPFRGLVQEAVEESWPAVEAGRHWPVGVLKAMGQRLLKTESCVVVVLWCGVRCGTSKALYGSGSNQPSAISIVHCLKNILHVKTGRRVSPSCLALRSVSAHATAAYLPSWADSLHAIPPLPLFGVCEGCP